MKGRKIIASIVVALGSALALSACGTGGVQLSKSNPDYSGAVIFRDHCAGCHTLGAAGAEGSAFSVQNRVRTSAPNFNYRKESVPQILYALRNGGFSGEVMPENIVVGKQAKEVAKFLAKYSGADAEKEPGEGGAGE